ncbi:MAG: sulfate/thiosulfate ABC transporter permease CysW, partial [Kofleriaceae bacterium]|nr:sulfate/thiosulfate ABC transporter permease CysW [Kofleriaceae bacterium]
VPLHVEAAYKEYNHQAAFAVASLLAVLALITLVARRIIARRMEASK